MDWREQYYIGHYLKITHGDFNKPLKKHMHSILR